MAESALGECYIAALTADADVQIEALEAKVAELEGVRDNSGYINILSIAYDSLAEQFKDYEAKAEVLEERLTDAQDKSQDRDAIRNQRDYFQRLLPRVGKLGSALHQTVIALCCGS